MTLKVDQRWSVNGLPAAVLANGLLRVVVPEAAAVELVDHGVLVNAVGPGSSRPGWLSPRGETSSRARSSSRSMSTRSVAAGRAAAPDEVAHATAWLASSANTYTTGQRLTVDGGLTARF